MNYVLRVAFNYSLGLVIRGFQEREGCMVPVWDDEQIESEFTEQTLVILLPRGQISRHFIHAESRFPIHPSLL